MMKGQIVLGTLIGLLVFLIVLFVAVLPIISSSVNTASTTMLNNLSGMGSSTISLSFIVPLLLALSGLVAVAYMLFIR